MTHGEAGILRFSARAHLSGGRTFSRSRGLGPRLLYDADVGRWYARLLTAIGVALVGAGAMAGAGGAAQRFGRGRSPIQARNPDYDGAFTFCRIMFRQNPYGDGDGWSVDYPRADINLSYRLSELTSTKVSRNAEGDFNHVLLRLTDDTLYKCPFVMMTEPGGSYFGEEEAAHLRDYLLKGGFLWVDDFWGERAWANWAEQIGKALPSSEYPFRDIPLAHQIFHMLYQVNEVPQIPSINFWSFGGGTSERGAESAVPHARAIFDERGHMLVLATHNTDFGDAFEREGENRAYFDRFAGVGYAFGINALLYAMSH
jgi:hypothetical protein